MSDLTDVLLRDSAEMFRVINTLQDEVKWLKEWIVEADSVFNLDGKRSTIEECTGLVRMCHEGRAAMDDVKRLHSLLREVRRLNCHRHSLVSIEEATAMWQIENLLSDELDHE